jgi:hypothetical protein
MVAVTVVVPAPVLVARPMGVRAATFAPDEVQVNHGVMSLVVTSLKSARALNFLKPPSSKSVAAGDTTREIGLGPLTVKVAAPTCPSNSAVMMDVPGARPVAYPEMMVATDGNEDVHKANVVRS